MILHRVNTLKQLETITDLSWGCEIDLRSDVQNPKALHLAHDPWTPGEEFEPWLAAFASKGLHGPLILNTKEDSLEARVLELLAQYKISNFFFLDTTLPTLVKWTQQNGVSKFAVRYSVYEALELAKAFAEKVEWLWVDCFQGIPAPFVCDIKAQTKMKVCLVSPELQGVALTQDQLSKFREWTQIADAVCTKQPQEWLRVLST